jgi:hypothetical protein
MIDELPETDYHRLLKAAHRGESDSCQRMLDDTPSLLCTEVFVRAFNSGNFDLANHIMQRCENQGLSFDDYHFEFYGCLSRQYKSVHEVLGDRSWSDIVFAEVGYKTIKITVRD